MASAQHSSLPSSRLDSAYLQGGGFSQAKQRARQRLTDQHGRKYFAVIEIRSGDPVGAIEPMFDAPLRVPPEYLRKSADVDNPTALVIQYEAWIGNLEAAHAEWTKRSRELARKQLGSAFDGTREVPHEIAELVGPKPQPVEPVYAAMQGNRWVLGFTKRIDTRLYDFFAPEQLAPRTLNLAKYDFRDTTEDPTAEVPDRAFDYDAAAPDEAGLDDLEMQLDEDDDLECQFDPEASGGQRVPVGSPLPGAAPSSVRLPSTKHAGIDGEKDKPRRGRRPMPPTDLPPAS